MDWEAACLPTAAAVFCAGIGAERALAAAHRAVAAGVHGLISFGSAAGVDPQVASGTLLVTATATEVGAAVAGSGKLLEQWAKCRLQALEPQPGVIVQCPEVLHSVAQKRALYERSAAQAADMESAGVAAVAAAHGLPFVAVRVVLDAACTRLPAELVSACDERGRVRPGAMLKALAQRPGLLLSLPGLAQSQRQVTNILTAAGRLLVAE